MRSEELALKSRGGGKSHMFKSQAILKTLPSSLKSQYIQIKQVKSVAHLKQVLQVPAGHHVNGLFALSETGEINETGQHLRPFIVSLSRKRAKRIYYTITLKILLGYKHTMFSHEIDSFKHKIQFVFASFSNY